jgi:RNase P subunit RPR2
MTKKRYCDYCNGIIEGDYLKVCLSQRGNLTHHTDMCLKCDEKLLYKKNQKEHKR